MEKKINLEEIIQECVGIMVGAKNTTPMDYGECKFILKYFGEKLLELAAENARLKLICSDSDCRNETYRTLDGYYCCNECDSQMDEVTNKQSILDTIKQVE